MFGDDFPFPEFCINEHVYRIRLQKPLSQEFGYFWLSSEPILEEMRIRGTGVAIPGLNSTAARGLPMAVPPTERLLQFDEAVGPLVRHAFVAARESRKLAHLRDILFSRLLTGEIRIKDAEMMVSQSI
jgi:type I restriction enzyme S subunit